MVASATTEARCNLPHGIGLVKLMGRSSGYIASYASLASGDVDLCLVPEINVILHGKHVSLCLSTMECDCLSGPHLLNKACLLSGIQNESCNSC